MKKVVGSICYLFFCIALCGESVSCSAFKLGVENISSAFVKKLSSNEKKACTIGLITNQTGTDQNGKRTIDIVRERGFDLVHIFVPEHGFDGTQAGRDVHDGCDKSTGIPIVSLYGHGSGKMIIPEHLKNIDALLFDIQDSGMRHYTYISTLVATMKIAAEYDKKFVILDRPNPLGSLMEGPLVDPTLISFISVAPIPLRHGMTIGELAWYFNGHVLEKPAQLHVVRMRGYDRSQGFMGTFLHQLSPNLQSLQSCYGYSFLGLLGEIKPFDVGVGTPMAFRCIMLPERVYRGSSLWTKAEELLRSYGITSFAHEVTSKKTKKVKRGLRLEFPVMDTICSFQLFISLLMLFKKEAIPFSFSAAFDKAVGSKDVQKMIAGTINEKLFSTTINQGLTGFCHRARHSFLYKPVPSIGCYL